MASEKILLGNLLSRKWNDPGRILNMTITGAIVGSIASATALVATGRKAYSPLPLLSILALYDLKLKCTPKAPNQSKYLILKSASANRNWKGKMIPASTLVELYIADEIDFTMDVLEAMYNMDEFCCYIPGWSCIRFLILQLFPNFKNSSVKDKKTTKREIADHYDRGNDFFNAFLGERMVYTSGVYEKDSDTLVTAQDNKMRKICEKLRLKPGMRLLDIGCGWGTLAGYANKHYNTHSTGVTLSEEGAKWCRDNHKAAPGAGSIDFITVDYRDIPDGEKFDVISSVEMAEHVGLRNFQVYLNKVSTNLVDDGVFYMQVAGLRKGSDWKDIAWGLFMGEYIFPGADASTPSNWYILQLEQAGFEVESIENIGIHYSLTLNDWYNNWMSNEAEISKTYPAALCRLWRIFLAWSTLASKRGTATCWMMTAHKTKDCFDRTLMIPHSEKHAERAKFPHWRK